MHGAHTSSTDPDRGRSTLHVAVVAVNGKIKNYTITPKATRADGFFDDAYSFQPNKSFDPFTQGNLQLLDLFPNFIQSLP